ncbi:DTW domain-containing protein [Vibrio sp. ZSDZ34]|jgi:DTW domain-containing protein YfiP|uniref:tRNA-uridine aminocarboxypropyltransferase n=1 Tax=Vibrio gelatinilyticus TaxID=2893468 RepID=A0A9X1WE64_9VIBR|nr:tRNA-uridine aminocarboxypropyltransferase [Vibrio gelatinilyticus]MCJ2376650.1 DTW domain-containing protein [Vibrio gelatinilyticus]
MRIHAFHRLLQYRQSIATKPFKARGAKVNRCTYCQVAKQYCICEHQPSIESKFAALIILSENEVCKPSNTGRLILDVITDGHAFQWNRTEPQSELIDLINHAEYQPIIVFPEEYVDDKQRLVSSSKTSAFNNKKPLFIFLDGSWREARKMFRKSDYLSDLPVLSIKPDALSNYIMRKSDNDAHLATVEVASLVFGQYGEPGTEKLLSSWFEVFKETYMMSKTRYSSDPTRPVLTSFLNRDKSLD